MSETMEDICIQNVRIGERMRSYIKIDWKKEVFTEAPTDATKAAPLEMTGIIDEAKKVALDGVTGLQSALDAKVPTSRTINNKALTGNISLTNTDVGAAAANHSHGNFSRSAAGFVPAATGSTTTRYLREDGTWQVPPGANAPKLYPETGQNTDGAMTQKAVTDALAGKASATNFISERNDCTLTVRSDVSGGVISARVNTNSGSNVERFDVRASSSTEENCRPMMEVYSGTWYKHKIFTDLCKPSIDDVTGLRAALNSRSIASDAPVTVASISKKSFCGRTYPQVIKVSGSSEKTKIYLFSNSNDVVDGARVECARVDTGSPDEWKDLVSAGVASACSFKTPGCCMELEIDFGTATGTYVARVDFAETEDTYAGSLYFMIEKT